MKRIFKKLCMGVTMCAMLVAMAPEGRARAETENVPSNINFPVPAEITERAKAETKNIPSKVRVFTGSYGTSDRVEFSLKDDVRVKSVKSSSKDLIVKLTSSYYSNTNGTIDNNHYTVGMYGKKNGKYTVTVNLTDGSSKKITVFVYPIPYSYKIDGKKSGYLNNTSKKSVKVNFSFEKGNKLQNLSYNVEKKVKNANGYQTETTYKSFKNGGTVKINSQPYEYTYSYSNSYDNYSSEYESMNSELFAYTYVKVKYKDKYTKQTEEFSISIASKLVK